MLSLWQMLKGRAIGAIVAALLAGLSLLGFDVVAETTIEQATIFATAIVTFFQFLGYSLFHTIITKRKLERHQIAQENLDRLR
jgi:uncharacterized protein (DUF58 family)